MPLPAPIVAQPGNYRDRLYSRYPDKHVGWQDTSEATYDRWAKVAGGHIRGWLPATKEARCLDIGCGPGNVLYLLKKLGYSNLAGVDISDAWMPAARRICPNVTHGDAREYLRTRAREFDLITAFDVIEHLSKDEVFEFLDLIFQALRPGGALILQTPNAESPWGCALRYGDFTHELAFNSHSLGYCCDLAGFEKFQAREAGPYFHGLASLLRKIIWSVIRTGLLVWNLAETGSRGSGVYTRVFLAHAIRPL